MRFQKVLLSALVLATCTSAAVSAQAASSTNTDEIFQKAVINDVESFVRNAYNPYYKINSINLSTSDYSTTNNVLTTQVGVSLNKTLKAKTVYEIPYVKGLNKKLEKLKTANDTNVTNAEEYLNLKIKDYNDYIGISQDQNDRFRITANIVNGKLDLKNAKLEFLNGLVDWIPADAFIPNEETIVQNGENDLVQGIDVIKKSKEKKQDSSVQAQGIGLYDRIAARDYANAHTSEVTSSPWYNHSYWNSAYTMYDNDCANFVSQSLNYGGLPTDSTWAAGKIAWINTGLNRSDGLKQYMVDTKNYFYETTKTGVSAGGWIFATGYSHVMFVVANDGVTMLFSAHTNDRKQASFAGFDSTYKYYYIWPAFLP